MKKVLDWLEHRTGYRGVAEKALHEPVLGGASFFYVFGSVLLFLLLLQMATGILLAFYYSPSSSDAWSSVAYIQDQVTLGWLIRGLHHHGASAIVIVAGLHLFQTALFGAYKKPRELNWLTGVMLLGLLLAFALTGYLLPWDQTGYWATKVATGIAAETPVLGDQVQQAAQGGNEYGNLTLTRFYALHVFVLPALTLGLVGVHLYLFRRHGVTPRWGRTQAQLEARAQPFWPDQLFKDLVAMAVAFAALFGFVWAEGGARLDGPADPASNFDARPEWYFRPLFQMLKYFEGTMETVAALGVPAIVGALLLGLPLLDRGESRSPARRVLPLGLLGALIVATGVLTTLSFRQDAADEELAERQEVAEADGLRARALAVAHGVPAAGGTAVFTTPRFHLARTVWARDCASCHEGDERKAPVIGAGYNGRAWIAAFLRDPQGDAFFGRTKVGQSDAKMDAFEGPDDQLKALTELVYGETGATDVDAALANQGRALFHDEDNIGCTACHRRLDPVAAAPVAPAPEEGEGDEEEAESEEECEVCDLSGPDLAGRGRVGHLMRFIMNPAHPDFFGAQYDDMGAFEEKLDGAELQALADYLTWLRDASPDDVEALDAP